MKKQCVYCLEEEGTDESCRIVGWGTSIPRKCHRFKPFTKKEIKEAEEELSRTILHK